jgi:hypothetical protein
MPFAAKLARMEPVEFIIAPGDDLPPCDERIAALNDYWRAIRPAPDRLPGRQHFDPLDVPRLLSWIWLLDVHRDPLRFRYRLMGTEQVRVIGSDTTGQWLHECFPHVPAAPTYRHFLAAAEHGMISYNRGFPVLHVPKEYILTERIFLPLARDGHQVDMLLALTVYHSAHSSRRAAE